MSNKTTVIEMVGDDGETVSTGNIDEANFTILRCAELLRREASMRSAAGYSMDKARNEALYMLTGEVAETLAAEEETSETLPWLERNTELEKVEDLYGSMERVIEYYKENADLFNVLDEAEE
tara:strand:- start:550 stop:915 length:366 start_codon:yes stop_codon:yes gene_type:complete